MSKIIVRGAIERILRRIDEPRRWIQVIMGPRQVGKTTAVRQVAEALAKRRIPCLMFSADNIPATQNSWIGDCWATARAQLHASGGKELVLVIDEIQKLNAWSEVVKKEWDDDTLHGVDIKVVLLGSSRVLLQKGLADSLAGRFETIKMSHWSYPEMREAFGLSLDQYIYYGGYPGAAPLIGDPERWAAYIRDSIIDTAIGKDILYSTPIHKPALLRQTFELGACYSGRIVSLTKIVGSLQDAGNTTTLSGYLNILAESGLLAGLQKFSIDKARRRASIPKFQVFNSALRNTYAGIPLSEALCNPKAWGHLFESAIGAHLAAGSFAGDYQVYYWREGNLEVDYVIKKGDKVVAIEVKSNAAATNRGLSEFRERYRPHASLVVGRGGMDAGHFLEIEPVKLFE